MPIYHDLLWPTLDAIQKLGGSATIQEVNEHRLWSNPLFPGPDPSTGRPSRS
jgi:hypothetical protein